MIPSIQSSGESSGGSFSSSSIAASSTTSKSTSTSTTFTSTSTNTVNGESRRRSKTFSSCSSFEDVLPGAGEDSSSSKVKYKIEQVIGCTSIKEKTATTTSSSSRSSRLLTTPHQLREILSMRYYCSTVPFRHYDEIIAGLYLGDMKTAKNILNLEKIGITHIINAAYSPSPFTDRELCQVYYEDRNFSCNFLGIAAQDYPSYKIGAYFEQTTEFIHEALKTEGKVLVHCQVGVSRSASIVIAYLMMKKKMSAIQAVTFVGAIRPIFPNEGFLKQICELEYRLKNPKNVLVRSLSTVSRRTFRKVFNKK